jgi:hypothetical protein
MPYVNPYAQLGSVQDCTQKENQSLQPRDGRFSFGEERGNLAQSCLSKAFRTVVDGWSDWMAWMLGSIQLHAAQPHAAKVLSSSQTSSLANGCLPRL